MGNWVVAVAAPCAITQTDRRSFAPPSRAIRWKGKNLKASEKLPDLKSQGRPLHQPCLCKQPNASLPPGKVVK